MIDGSRGLMKGVHVQCDDLPALIMAIVTTPLLRQPFLPHLL